MFKYRQIAFFANKFGKKLKSEHINVVETLEATATANSVALTILRQKISPPQVPQKEAWDMGVPIDALADYILEEKKRWNREQLIKDIKYCQGSDIGFLEPTNVKHWIDDEYVRLTTKGQWAAERFSGWWYCLDLSIKKYGEIKTVFITFVLSSLFWLFVKDIYHSIASTINWPKI